MDPLEEVRQLYYRTTAATIERDFARAIDLLKGMPSDEERGRAHVYMEGLAEMRRDWSRRTQRTGKPREKRTR